MNVRRLRSPRGDTLSPEVHTSTQNPTQRLQGQAGTPPS